MNLDDSNTFPVTIVRQETILSCVRQVLKETFHIYTTMTTMIISLVTRVASAWQGMVI